MPRIVTLAVILALIASAVFPSAGRLVRAKQPEVKLLPYIVVEVSPVIPGMGDHRSDPSDLPMHFSMPRT